MKRYSPQYQTKAEGFPPPVVVPPPPIYTWATLPANTLRRLSPQYQMKAEGLPPPAPNVSAFAWHPIFPDLPMPRWGMALSPEFLPYPAQRPITIIWTILEQGNVLYAVININETWEEHFQSRGWLSPQDQIDDGFPYFLQPTLGEGFYEEIWDAGGVFNNVIVNVDFSTTPVAGTVSVTVKIASSLDGVTYSAFTIGSSRFVDSLQYVKIRIEFTAID